MFKKLLVLVLVIAGVATWIQRDPLTLADRAQADELPDIVEPERHEFLGEGIVVRYQSGAVPTYYLLYETKGNRFVRKELRFTETRGCAPAAGDLPCVYLPGPNPVPVLIGSHVRVRGLLDAQRIIVESIDVVADADGDFSVRTVEVGEEMHTNGVSLRAHEVYSGGPCEMFLGCYSENIPRVRFSLDAKNDRKETTMVPGMLENIPGGAVLLLWGDEALGRATFVIAHGKSR